MYSELSKQFLYNKERFEITKSKEYLKIICPCCSQIFEFTKHKIQTNWRRSSAKILYCTYECALKTRLPKTEKTFCLYCNKEFIKTLNKEQKDKKFCNKSCSILYLNYNRSEEEKLRINKIVSKKLTKKYKLLTLNLKFVFTLQFNINYLVYTKRVYKLNCNICNKSFISKKSTGLLCSLNCFKERLRQMHKEKPHLILNRSNPESYLEKSFRVYIETKGYIKDCSYKQEHHFVLPTGKRYIADFYFPALNLIIEMDRKTT